MGEVRSATDVQAAVAEVAAGFAAERSERQRRLELDPADFALLAEAGLQASGLPVERGGLFADAPSSARTLCELQRTLAHGDPAVALVTAMHPAVLALWLCTPSVPEPHAAAWSAQRDAVFATVEGGAWWGTITSEPGSGGDVANTRAVALPAAGDGGLAYRLSGAKHFGSGSGITSYMLTSGRPVDEAPDWFVLDVRDVPWDGSTGMRLVAEWDGHGMAATQSHGFTFQDFPAERFAWPGHLVDLQGRAGPFVGALFTAVIAGVVDVAMATARSQLAPRRGALRAYEQVEWTEAETEAWLIRQAYEGMLRAVESDEGGTAGALSVVRGKTAIATLSERVLGRLCRILGGGTYGRGSPFGAWFEDVRALGFLRPPWGLAYDRLYDGSWPAG